METEPTRIFLSPAERAEIEKKFEKKKERACQHAAKLVADFLDEGFEGELKLIFKPGQLKSIHIHEYRKVDI